MRKRKVNKKRVFFLFFLCILFLLCIFSIKRMIYFESFFQDLFVLNDNDSMDVKKYLEEEVLLQVEEAKELLNLTSFLSEFSSISATVVRHDTSFWFDEIVVNKGRSDGVSKGDAVISSSGLIGRVIKCGNDTATVQLLSAKNLENQVSIKIKLSSKKYIYGILKNKDGNLVVEGIDKKVSLNEEMPVLTSGLSDVFPSGILIGKIKSVALDHYGVGQIAEVELASNLEMITMVSILKSKR